MKILLKFDVEFFGGMLLGFSLALIICTLAFARDNGQYSQADPAIKQWIEKLENKNKQVCCDNADGYDVQWDIKEGKYRVYLYDQWQIVPDDAVIDEPNKLNKARVWYFPMNDTEEHTKAGIRCFMPGPGV